MMNTEQMSEFFFLYTLTNDPITYEDKEERQGGVESTKAAADPLIWVVKLLDWLNRTLFRAGGALPST